MKITSFPSVCLLIVAGLLFAAPTFAGSSFYALAGDPAANDANSCRTAADPCATLTGALSAILATANPSDSTLYAAGTFTEAVDISDAKLEGLTMTWHNEGVRPVINATGLNYAINVSGPVHNLKFKHIEITGALYYGLYIGGTTNTHNQNVEISDLYIHDFDPTSYLHYGMYIYTTDGLNIQNNTISSLGSATTDMLSTVYVYGIYLYQTDNATVQNNTISQLEASTTYTGAVSSLYTSMSGLYIQEADNAVVRDNAISNMSSITQSNSAATVSYNYIYGMYLSNALDAVVRDNTVSGIAVQNTSLADTAYGYGSVYGMYAATVTRGIIRHNTVSDVSNTIQVEDTEYTNPNVYGIAIAGSEDNVIRHNTVKGLAAIGNNGSGLAKVYGVEVTDNAGAQVHHNTVKDTTAHHVTGSATNTAMRFFDSPDTNVYHNRLKDFIAVAPAGTSSSIGMEVGYNTEADIFNNYVYFTDPTTQNGADGILLLSSQSKPVRIFHNTLAGLLTCLDIDYLNTTKFLNNLCYMTDAAAMGIEVTSEDQDLSLLTSNYNAYYNTTGIYSFNDTTVGVMSLADWRSGIYGKDAKSTTKKPYVHIEDASASNYLHVKKQSEIKHKGKKKLSFSGDEEMTAELRRDWDGQKRTGKRGPTPGADQFKK